MKTITQNFLLADVMCFVPQRKLIAYKIKVTFASLVKNGNAQKYKNHIKNLLKYGLFALF